MCVCFLIPFSVHNKQDLLMHCCYYNNRDINGSLVGERELKDLLEWEKNELHLLFSTLFRTDSVTSGGKAAVRQT